MLFGCGDLVIDLLELDLELLHLGIEVMLFDHTFGIAVDEPRLACLQMTFLLFQRRRIGSCLFILLKHLETTLVFALQATGIRQQRNHLVPD